MGTVPSPKTKPLPARPPTENRLNTSSGWKNRYYFTIRYRQEPAQKPQSAIISGNYKLLKDLETVQLLDLEKDLSEKNDLSKRCPRRRMNLNNC